jgi:poly-beta-1,6-N-acetyl-D-glucosamine biosynthesis protein PgaD
MRTLILDQYTHQSIFKRMLGNTLTGFAWAFWIYLWLPLFAAITLLLETHPEEVTSAASRSILELIATLSSHVLIVFIMIAVFFAWSLLQWLGKHHRHQALQKQQVEHAIPVSPVAFIKQDEKVWRHAQRMVVSHDDNNGQIKVVDVLKFKKQGIHSGSYIFVLR